MRKSFSKHSLLGLSTGLLLLFMAPILEPPLRAETNSAIGSTSAKAHIDFMIHIPEVLSLEIDTLHIARKSSLKGVNGAIRAGKPVDLQDRSHISVSAAGSLAPGSVMALTATDSDPLSTNQGKPDIRAGITWTASRTHWTGSLSKDRSIYLSGHHDNPLSFTYDRHHRFSPGETHKPIFYIICAP